MNVINKRGKPPPRRVTLHICKCGEHGYFLVYPGAYMVHLASKEEAHQELEDLFMARKVSRRELQLLRDIIDETPLPAEVPSDTKIVCELSSQEERAASEALEEFLEAKSPSDYVN